MLFDQCLAVCSVGPRPAKDIHIHACVHIVFPVAIVEIFPPHLLLNLPVALGGSKLWGFAIEQPFRGMSLFRPARPH